MILFPVIAAVIFNVAIGGNIKNVNISFQNNETADCLHNVISNKDSCFHHDNNNLTLSCEVLNGLRELKYNLVRISVCLLLE